MGEPLTARFDDLRQVRPLQAWRSMRALIADPQATGEVFRIIEALKGNAILHAVQRLRSAPEGRALLDEKPDILPLLNDRAALRALPGGSLGRAYLHFVEARDISAEGLVAASEEAPREREQDPDARWLADRLRDIHDLQHVVCGYGPDELGELCLLAFMHAQTPNRGIGFIIFMARRQFRRTNPQIDIDACVAEGRRTGECAPWFAQCRWEGLMAEPLEALRRALGVQAPTRYRAALASLAPDCGAAR
ncbi:MAG: hypothetical protein H6990_04000 [Pseudomonadales bacterium]|nr:hypothetical protein [Pseudomonadales bacterium]